MAKLRQSEFEKSRFEKNVPSLKLIARQNNNFGRAEKIGKQQYQGIKNLIYASIVYTLVLV